MRKTIKGLIRIYQRTISVVIPASCRFYPPCSEYCYQAVDKYGAMKGLWMGARRISRCHPLNPGGYDPVK